jgi:hypothetical protein
MDFSDLPTPLTNVGYQGKSGSNYDIAKSTRLAHTRSAGMSVIPPLLEDKRTSRGEPISVAIDPQET